jgi:hypothetical protein
MHALLLLILMLMFWSPPPGGAGRMALMPGDRGSIRAGYKLTLYAHRQLHVEALRKKHDATNKQVSGLLMFLLLCR